MLVRRRDAFVSTALARFIEVARQHLVLSAGTRQAAERRRARAAKRFATLAGTSNKIDAA